MSDEELLDFKTELYDIIERDSFDNSTFPEESFFNWASYILCETGFIDEAHYSPYRNGSKGLRIDGYSWCELDRTFCGIIVELSDEQYELSSVTNTEAEKIGKRVQRYLAEASSRNFRNSLFRENTDISSNGRVTAELIADIEEEIIKYKIIVITDHVKSTREKEIAIDPIADRSSLTDKQTSIEIWDLKRLMDLEQTTSETEDFNVKLLDFPIVEVIEASKLKNGTITYLGVMPASVLSDVYDKFGQRLLESNVRTFLDFTNQKNNAMRKGLLKEPENFFAYNNGITVTATGADIVEENGKLIIKSIENMQIVNGGQTTAAIYFTPREKGGIDNKDGTTTYYKSAKLSKVHVQMKLTILNAKDDPEFCDRYKADIARYANFQTAVNDSDLTSNKLFHKDMERLSRKISTRTYPPTNWFYERTRGQYNTQLKGMKKEQDKKTFKLKYPKNQKFKKEEMVKYEVTWLMQPHIVKKGTNPSRKFLMGPIEEIYKKDPIFKLDEIYYENVISKILLFKQLDSLVNKSQWYKEEKGLKAEAVTYTIALVRKRLVEINKDINLPLIYSEQSISKNLGDVLCNAAKIIRRNIMDYEFRGGAANPAEFCRDEKGWLKIQKTKIDISGLNNPEIIDINSKSTKSILSPQIKDVTLETLTIEEPPKLNIDQNINDKLSEQGNYSGHSVVEVSELSREYWEALVAYNKKLFKPLDPEVVFPMLKARSLRTGIPLSKKQNRQVERIYVESKKRGFDFLDESL